MSQYSYKSPDATLQDFERSRNEFSIDAYLQFEKSLKNAKTSYNLWHYKLWELNHANYKELKKHRERLQRKIREYLK